VIVFLRKESLLGESLSHAAYPGVVLGVVIAGLCGLCDQNEFALAFLILGGAAFSSILGLGVIYLLQNRLKVKSDAALCFVLSSFFGIGLTIASRVQVVHPMLYQQIQVYLYGQAASMTDVHIAIYGALCLTIMCVLFLFYKELLASTFDKAYAKSLGIQTKGMESLVFAIIVFAVVIGLRSVGVVLMSAMLIAPAAAARQFTHKMYKMMCLAALFGALSAFLGNYLSLELSAMSDYSYLALPTGPMIVVVASAICLGALLFAPERGLLLRLFRIISFRRCFLCENLLKMMWNHSPSEPLSFSFITQHQPYTLLYVHYLLWTLKLKGWVFSPKKGYFQLTEKGKTWAERIIRLHQLWEIYLVYYLGMKGDRVHRNAEEMEHILTPELEIELAQLVSAFKYPSPKPIHSLE
jgi:manganese/zinc/iron transport system permease protein